ncbi:MAG: N-acetylmuramoyl-L-alanine amidase, partial [Candidatus Moraniibacteriota bacterium]
QPASSADRQSAISEQDAITNKQNSADKTQKVIVNKNSITGKIVAKLVSWGFQKVSDRKIDTIVLHSSYDALGDDPFSVVGVIEEYKQAQVAPHYLIARDGTVYQLVADQNIAWHAGVAKMPDGRTNVNSFSLGIEIINTKDGKFTAEQYGAVNRLIGDLKKAYPIKNILGHSDIAPDRKTDPWGIDWKKINR